jgi:hypothetical protein
MNTLEDIKIELNPAASASTVQTVEHTGSQAVLEALIAEGVDTVFG